jgi:hypothetical protein
MDWFVLPAAGKTVSVTGYPQLVTHHIRPSFGVIPAPISPEARLISGPVVLFGV